MPLVACLDLPAFPLQLAWKDEPVLRSQPVVVIDEDRPQGLVLWACERARASAVLPGQRYAHALGLHRGLRARVVPPARIEAAIVELREALHALSPSVEPNDEPGTFWLDGDGLERIPFDPGDSKANIAKASKQLAAHANAATSWGLAIQRTITKLGFAGAVVVGFSRFATFAIARATKTGITVLRNDADERAAAAAVPLARLDLDPSLRDSFARLGVTRLGEMVRLPGGGILERFGKEAHRMYQLAAGERWDPIVPLAPPEAPDERIVLDDDVEDSEQLVFVLRPAIERLLERLAAKGRALTALHVELVLRHAVGNTELRAECIKPAAPTLDGRALLRLVHLRVTGAPPAAPINAARIWADDVAATREQLTMFAQRPRRDLRLANEALAAVRAELGDDAVVHAVLREGHLPEATFYWEPITTVPAAQPQPKLVKPLVRRMHTKPQMLPPQARQVRDDGWLLSGLEHGAVTRIVGPYVVSGGWWAHEQYREYHFAELRRGDCLWVYFDRNRRRWFCQGAVE